MPNAEEIAGFAPIEDLDPAPAAPGPSGRRGELVLGLLLVLGLVGFGGWQWWQDTGRLSAYRAGAQAVAAHDWDAARAAYLAAAGYGDAAARTQTVTAQLTERDTQYQQALAARAQGDWLGALAAIRRVQAITPGYRDTAGLGQALRAQVYTAALSGAVALRPDATPPGLYVYGARGWRPLAGSDSQSQVVGRCPDGAILFDGAGPDRPLIVAAPGAPPRARLALTLGHFRSYSCTRTGVAATSFGGNVPAPRGPGWTPTYEVAYQAFGSPRLQVPALPGPAWHVLAQAPAAGQLLLLDTTAITATHWLARLYLADAEGGARRLVFEGHGIPSSLSFSPDGRYLLLNLQQLPGPAGTIPNTSMLVDLARPGRPQPATYSGQAAGEESLIFASFVQRPGHPAEVLIQPSGPAGPTIELYDPAHLTHPVLRVTVDQDPRFLEILGRGTPEGGLLMGWQRALYDAQPAATILYVDGRAQPHVANLLFPAETGLYQAWVRAGRLVVATQARPLQLTAGPWPYTFASWPLAQLPSGPLAAGVFYTGTLTGEWQGLGQSWYVGPGLLAYVTPDGELHARTYDGRTDLALESGVRGFSRLDPDDAGP